jgi:hypothetical protein
MTPTSIVTTLAALAVTLGAGAGCKTEKVIQPDPQTQADLEQCKKAMAEKDKLIKDEESENARLMREKGSGAEEIVVAIEGNALTVRPGNPGEVRPIDDKAIGEASREFLNVVERSRGAIQKCYEQALKKNIGLQARTVTLSVSASFAAGQFKSSNFAPSLGDTFDSCIRTVASKWTLPASSPAMTFKAQVSLTPS